MAVRQVRIANPVDTVAGSFAVNDVVSIDAILARRLVRAGYATYTSDPPTEPHYPNYGAIDHGSVAGTLEITTGYGLHDVDATGPLVLTPTGDPGAVLVVRVTGVGPVTLPSSVVWETAPLGAGVSGEIILTHWIDGWVAGLKGASSGGGGGGGGGAATGTGSPEGVRAASPGAEFIDINATLGARKWLKVTGTGNTGWKVVTGDTGWRLVNDWVRNPADLTTQTRIGGNLWVRRINDEVYLSAHRLVSSAQLLISVPTGFWSPHARVPSTTWNGTTVKILGETPGYTRCLYHMGAGNWPWATNAEVVVPVTSWATVDAWPTSLPGVAA